MKLFICLTYIHILVINICCSNNNLFSDKKKIQELDPIIITSKLGSNIVITIPNSSHENRNNIELTKPNGEIVKQKNAIITDKGNRNITRNVVDDKKLLIERILTTCTVNFNNDCEGVAQENLCENQLCDINDVIYEIGPLEAVDFGNWVIVKEFKNADGDIIEMFRVISVEIKEEKNLKPNYTSLNIGEPYKVQFKEKIPNLESCEIIAPESTFDRYYERDLNNLDFCGYIIDNVTVEDAGLWKIVAVGEIIYEGYGMLEIGNKIL